MLIPIVYLFAVEDEIKYIGESRRGYSRALSYNKNKVMLKQRKSIETILKQGKTVEDFNLMLNSLFNKNVQPFIISWLKYNPQDEIKKLKIL